MSRSVQSCSPSTSIEEAEDLMMAYAIHRLVVIDSDGRLCGLVSLDEIARQAAAWDGKGEIDLERVALTLAEISRCNGSADEDKPATASPQTDHSLLVQNSLAALQTLRDEIRVDLHLAGKELPIDGDAWRRSCAPRRRARGARAAAANVAWPACSKAPGNSGAASKNDQAPDLGGQSVVQARALSVLGESRVTIHE